MNGFVQQTFYSPSSPPEADRLDTSQGNISSWDSSGSRGRVPASNNLVMLNSPLPQNGIALASRSQSTAAVARSPSELKSSLERRPSATQTHYRQTSRTQGLYQHSRNTSYVNSPATSPLSPQLNEPASLVAAATTVTPEYQSLTSIHHRALERRPSDSPSNTVFGSVNSSSTSTLVGDRETGDAGGTMLVQKKIDRTHSVRSRRGHSHHRSQSKHQQQSQEQKTVGEYALHHLFNSVGRLA